MTHTPAESTIIDTAKDCALDWSAQTNHESPRTWPASNPIPDEDLDFCRDELGRGLSDIEANLFGAAFREAYGVCMAKRATKRGWDKQDLERDLAAARDHLAREARSSQALQARVAELEALLEAANRHAERLGVDLGEARVSLMRKSSSIAEWQAMDAQGEALEEKRLTAAAGHHVREVIWSWRNVDKHVPRDWTAAHPPDDATAQVLAEALGDDGFAAYSGAFRAAWREEVEAIADAAEVRHGSGRVKF